MTEIICKYKEPHNNTCLLLDRGDPIDPDDGLLIDKKGVCLFSTLLFPTCNPLEHCDCYDELLDDEVD